MNKMIDILAIDDDVTVQIILTAFLNRYMGEKGIQSKIKTLSDPVRGLFELSRNGEQYSVILLDVRLPKLTGDEIYNSLIYVNPNLLERILFVTGYPDDLNERFPDQSLNILQKPFRYQSFTEKISEILN